MSGACHMCHEEIERDEDIAGSVTFNYGVFPVCVKCMEED